MQSDLLSADREDEQPQPLLQPEPLSTPGGSQPEPAPVSETATTQPAIPIQKKRSRLNVAAISLGMIVLLLLVAVGWVGYWAFTLNTELTTTRGQLAALQGNYDTLQTKYTALTGEQEKLNADLTQSRADLDQANADLTTARADLDKSKEQNKNLTTQVKEAGELAEVLYAMANWDSESDILKIDRLVTEAGNKELTKQWDTLTKSPSEDAFASFFEYLIFATRESLR